MAGAALALFLVLGEFYLLCVNGCVSLCVCVCVCVCRTDMTNGCMWCRTALIYGHAYTLLSVSERVNKEGLISRSTRSRLFRVRLFSGSRFHWYWPPNSLQIGENNILSSDVRQWWSVAVSTLRRQSVRSLAFLQAEWIPMLTDCTSISIPTQPGDHVSVRKVSSNDWAVAATSRWPGGDHI